MSSPIEAIQSQPIYNKLVSRLDSAHQDIADILSAKSGISLEALEDMIIRLEALSKGDRKQIDSAIKRFYGDERKSKPMSILAV